MDGPTLLRRYAQGKRDFIWADLAGADLAQAQLSGINLSRANLSGATLVGANLSQANLTKAKLAGANLTGANLTGATLRRADLTAAQLDLVQLQQVDYYGAVLPPDLMALLPSDGGLESGEPLVQNSHPLTPAAAEPEQPSNPQQQAFDRPMAKPSDLDRRELWISLALLALGYLFYGVVLRMQQVAWPGWLLVGLPLSLGLWQEELVWFVPLVGLVGAIVALGLSAAVLIFAVPVALGIGVALAMGGSILGWGWGQTLKTTAWFSGLAFVAMHSSIWLFDGSNAYGGGGIVVNLPGLHMAGLLGLGLLAVGRGTLAYGQLIDQGYSLRHQGLLIGGSGMVGLLLGWWVGG
ncbi:MAG: pentapeptide repeat-containing protein [Leptolyngbya sp. DLM2.Bin27]|nr:MAG: pentapeptide repeat-containing protein [Leptolyngbya sp. DLM2.Bin27]